MSRVAPLPELTAFQAARSDLSSDKERLGSGQDRHRGCQLAPPSEVAKLCPLAVVIVALLALLADTAVRFSVVGPATSSQCSPSVVRMIVPLLPTIQHTVAD